MVFGQHGYKTKINYSRNRCQNNFGGEEKEPSTGMCCEKPEETAKNQEILTKNSEVRTLIDKKSSTNIDTWKLVIAKLTHRHRQFDKDSLLSI